MSTTRAKPWYCGRWVIPGTAALFGVAYLVVGVLGDEPGFGIGGLVTMLVVGGVALLAGRYSETMNGLLDRRDERINALDRDATVAMGSVMMLAVLVMGLIEIARGGDGAPYFQLASVGAVAYIGAFLWLRWRR